MFQDIHIRNLNHGDISDISDCLEKTIDSLNVPNIFVPPTLNYIITIMNGYGKTAGYFYKERLVAFASVVFPKSGKNNLGHFTRLNKKALLNVVQLEHICVIPSFRNQGIARKLIEYLLSNIDSRYSLLLSTISPQNIPSLSVALKLGQKIISYIDIYGVKRFLMLGIIKNTHNNFDIIERGSPLFIELNDLNAVVSALKNGYIGVDLEASKSVIKFIEEIYDYETI